MCAGRREDMKSTARTSNTKARTKKTTSKSTSMVAVTDDVTKLREQIDSSSCVNNGGKYSETKKKRAGSKLACLLPWYSHHVWCHSNAIATKKKGKPPWHCGASMLTKTELERRRGRNGRTVLALLCVSCQLKIFWPTGAFLRRLGTANIVQLAFFFRGFGSWLTCRRDRRCGMVLRCLRKFARRVENCIFPLYWSGLCAEDRHFTPPPPKKKQLRWEPRRSTSLLSPFLYLPLVL